MGFIVLWSLLP